MTNKSCFIAKSRVTDEWRMSESLPPCLEGPQLGLGRVLASFSLFFYPRLSSGKKTNKQKKKRKKKKNRSLAKHGVFLSKKITCKDSDRRSQKSPIPGECRDDHYGVLIWRSSISGLGIHKAEGWWEAQPFRFLSLVTLIWGILNCWKWHGFFS